MTATSPAPRELLSRRAATIAVVALCLLAAWLRLTDLGMLLPEILLRDGLKLVLQVELMRDGVWDGAGEPRWSRYPHLVSRIASLLPAADASAARTLDEHLRCASATWVQLRAVIAAFGVLAVPITYGLARYFLDRARSVLAAALVATSYLHVSLSLDIRPHVVAATTIALCVLAALRLRRKPSAMTLALAGGAAWLSIGALHTGFASLFVLAAAWFLRAGERRARGWLALAAALALVLVASWFFYPFALAHQADVGPGDERTIGLWGHQVYAERFDGSGFVVMARALWHGDPVLCALGFAGTVLLVFGWARAPRTLLHGRGRDALVALAFCIPFLLVFGLYRETVARYAMPILPFLAVAAARVVPARAALWALLLLALPLGCGLRFRAARAQPDTYELAAHFLAETASETEPIAVMPLADLPLFTADEALKHNAEPAWRTIWAQYQARRPGLVRDGPRFAVYAEPVRGRLRGERSALEALREGAFRWVVIARTPRANPQDAIREEIAREAELVRRFSPLASTDERPTWIPHPADPDTDSWVPRCFELLDARACGPLIEVYRLR